MFKDNGGFSFVLKPFNLRKDIIRSEPIAEGVELNKRQEYTMGYENPN